MESEQIWYYIKDGQKIGPISLADLQHLIQTKLLGGSDLVWKNGFENWVAIKTVSELNQSSPTSTPAPEESPVSVRPTPSPGRVVGQTAASPAMTAPLQLLRPLMQPMLMLGLLLVIGAKGCESVHVRWAGRLAALSDSERTKIENKYDRLLLDDDADQSELFEKRQDELDAAEYKIHDARVSADNAMRNVQSLGFIFEAAFIFGTLLLTAALVIAGFTEEGGGRWICLIMLAIIIFSVYVGGISWFGSYMSAVGSSIPGGPF